MKNCFWWVVSSFKKPSNAQGSQTRVVNSDIRSDATTGGNVAVSGSGRGVQNGAHPQQHGIASNLFLVYEDFIIIILFNF